MRKFFYSFFIVLFSINAGISQNDKTIPSFNNEGEAPQILGLGSLSNTQSISKDPLLPEIVQHMRTKYGVHTVILFGSRARGTGTAKSDYDIIGLQKSGEAKGFQDFFKGASLDIFIYPQSFGEAAAEKHPVVWQEAIVLHQPHHEGEQFIQDLKKAFAENQKDLSQTDRSKTKKDIIRLLTMNLDRGQKNEIREHFYRRKFLLLTLEKYFSIHNLTYMGSRRSLEWLKKHDPLTYAAFEKALAPNASTEVLQELLVQIAGPDLDIKAKEDKSIADNSKIKEKYAFSKDPLIPDIVRHIQETYGAHTVILYGSRAQGTATSKSDYDIVALRRAGVKREDVRDLFKGVYLDLHLLSDEALTDTYVSGYLSIVEGAAILSQKDNLGERLIQNIKKIYDRGFFTSDQIKQRIIDEIKINLSKIENTIVGYYYYNMVASDLLDYYFTLRNAFYKGSRESFRWLKKNDLTTYNLFEKALKPDASLESIKELADRVIAGTIYENK